MVIVFLRGNKGHNVQNHMSHQYNQNELFIQYSPFSQLKEVHREMKEVKGILTCFTALSRPDYNNHSGNFLYMKFSKQSIISPGCLVILWEQWRAEHTCPDLHMEPWVKELQFSESRYRERARRVLGQQPAGGFLDALRTSLYVLSL